MDGYGECGCGDIEVVAGKAFVFGDFFGIMLILMLMFDMCE